MDLKPRLIVHHGGEWVVADEMLYTGGRVNIFEDIPDSIDAQYVKQIIDSLGHTDIVKVHFLDPRKDFKTGIRYLGFDNKSCDPFLSLLLEFKAIHLYTKHEIGQMNNQVDCDIGQGSFVELLNSGVPRATDPLIDYDSEGSDEDDDEFVSARNRIREYKHKEQCYKDEMEKLKRVAESKGKHIGRYDSDSDRVSDFESSDESSDEEDFGYLIAPEARKAKKLRTDTEDGCGRKDSKFYVGQCFENATSMKKAIIDYAIQAGRDIVFSRNAHDKVGAHCRNKESGCLWRIWGSWERGEINFMVKTHTAEHTCDRTASVKKITTSWVATNFQARFKVNPYMKTHEIIETVWLEKGLKISRYMAYRARKEGQKLIVGEYEEQYGLLPRYAAEILRSNKYNTVKLKMNGNVFERLYICFDALKMGFCAGCFLKGPFGGQLLVAVGRDGNNQMFPIAWAVVDVESTDSWTWFLELLGTDLGIIEGAGYTFMSDQQKGLLALVAQVFPEAETRVCARHVYCNFRTVFGGGLEFRKQFWKIAKSNIENDFNANIEHMRAISEDAAEVLLKRNYKKWCRTFYSPLSCCDSVDISLLLPCWRI